MRSGFAVFTLLTGGMAIPACERPAPPAVTVPAAAPASPAGPAASATPDLARARRDFDAIIRILSSACIRRACGPSLTALVRAFVSHGSEIVRQVEEEAWQKTEVPRTGGFDLALLPVDGGASLPTPGAVVVAGNNPAWQWVVDRARALGRPCGWGGNASFDEWIPTARDGWLVVLCKKGNTVLPAEHLDLLPEGWEARVKQTASGVLRRKAPDGTVVVLVFGRDADALRREIDRLTFEDSERR